MRWTRLGPSTERGMAMTVGIVAGVATIVNAAEIPATPAFRSEVGRIQRHERDDLAGLVAIRCHSDGYVFSPPLPERLHPGARPSLDPAEGSVTMPHDPTH